MYEIEDAIGRVIRARKLTVAEVARKTNVRYSRLYNATHIGGAYRMELRADELLRVCFFLRVDPLQLLKEGQ